MLERHLVFTLFILKFLCPLQAHYKLYRSNGEVYRNPAIPHLPRWNYNKPIGHRKNMVNLWGGRDLSNILQQKKVKRTWFDLWLWFGSKRTICREGKNPNSRCIDHQQRCTEILQYPIFQNWSTKQILARTKTLILLKIMGVK